jgi:uncharacterized protein YjgD (DUF1641 family)
MTAVSPTTEDLVARLETLTSRVDELIARTEADRREREAWDRLRLQLTPVAEGAGAGVDTGAVDPEALAGLLVRLAEAAPDLERSLGTLMAMSELAGEVGEVGGVVFESLIERLDTLGRRGYFEFGAGVVSIVDRIVTSFDEDDVKALGDNIVLILETVKEMTQPEVMRMLQRTARILRDDEEPEKLSLFRLLREMRDPEVKLGLHRMLTVLRGLAAQGEAGAPSRDVGDGQDEQAALSGWDPHDEGASDEMR